MDTMELSALEAAIYKKLSEAQTRLHEATAIFRHYAALKTRSEVNRPNDRCMIPARAGENEGPARNGLYPGQYDNHIDHYEEPEQECTE